MNSQTRKKGPLKGDHQLIAGVRVKNYSGDDGDRLDESLGPSGGHHSSSTPPKDTKIQYSSRKSPISRKSPRSSPRSSPARRTPSPHHIHKLHKEGRVSPRTRGLKKGSRGTKLINSAAPAHDAKGTVGGGSRSAFASSKNTSAGKRGPSPSSNEVYQILSKGKRVGIQHSHQKSTGESPPTGGFEVNARQKPSALIAAPKVNPNNAGAGTGTRLILSKVSSRHRKTGRAALRSDRDREFLNNPIPEGDSILPWFGTNQTGEAGTQTGLRLNVHPDNEAYPRMKDAFGRRRSNSWGPSARRRALAASSSDKNDLQRTSSTKKKHGKSVDPSVAATPGGKSSKPRTGANLASTPWGNPPVAKPYYKEISIEDIDKMQEILSQMKEEMLRKEQESTIVNGPLREMLEQHQEHFDDVGTDLEIISNSVQDEHVISLEKSRRRAKSGPAALRRNYGDMKQVFDAMNEMQGTPGKSLRASFEEIEEEIRKKRLEGDGRTNGNAGPYAVYEAAQLRLRSSLEDSGAISRGTALEFKKFRTKNFDDNDTKSVGKVPKDIGTDDSKTLASRIAAKPTSLLKNSPPGPDSPQFDSIERPSLGEDFIISRKERGKLLEEPIDLLKSPPKVSRVLSDTEIPRLKLDGLNLSIKSPRSQNSCNSPDLSKQMLDIASPRSAFSKTSARSTLTNSSSEN